LKTSKKKTQSKKLNIEFPSTAKNVVTLTLSTTRNGSTRQNRGKKGRYTPYVTGAVRNSSANSHLDPSQTLTNKTFGVFENAISDAAEKLNELTLVLNRVGAFSIGPISSSIGPIKQPIGNIIAHIPSDTIREDYGYPEYNEIEREED